MISRLHRAFQRRAAKWFARRMVEIRPATPMVSFTFDDFPASALDRGGAILEDAGVTGTYYTSFGLADQTIETGKMFSASQVGELLRRGHELGCHTFHHCPSWETSASDFESSVEKNHGAAKTWQGENPMLTLSYPISYPRPETKRRMAKRFCACRGGGQTYNLGSTDVNYLRSVFIEQLRDEPARLRRLIDSNAQACGWLIFSTHDVADTPTRYGCTPGLLADLVRHALNSGSRILPVGRALPACLQTC